MNRVRRHIAPMMLVALLLTSLITGCQRKPLYVAQRGTLDVDVATYDIRLDLLWGLDWASEWQYPWDEALYGPIGYTEPTGIRANVYLLDALCNRTKYTTRNLPSHGGRVSLSTYQAYDIHFYNNDTEWILFSTDDATYHYATTRINTMQPYTRSSYANCNQPDQLFGTFMSDLYVTDDPEEYEIAKDENGNLIYVYKINASLTPYTFIYLYQVLLVNNRDDKGQIIVDANGITANGLAKGVDLFTRLTDTTELVSVTQDDVKPLLKDRQLTLPDGTTATGDILAARMMTWGLPGIDPLEKAKTRSGVQPADTTFVGVGLQLRNGVTYNIQQDVTDQMRQRPAGGIITLVVDAKEIPDSIINIKPPTSGGAFDATVDNWENEVEADITI